MNNGKPCCWQVISHKCSWELLFFDSKDTEVLKADRNKLVSSNEKQTDKFIPNCLTCVTQTCQLSVSTIVKVSVMKIFLGVAVVLCESLWPKKAGKGTEVQFLCTQGTLQGGRVEDHRLMFTRHLHSPQLYIQAILYIYKTDYMMSLTLYTLTSVSIFFILYSICFLTCWKGEFV